jgi:CRISPR-associated protein Csd2
MSTTIYNNPARRHDFLFVFDVTDGNPNGDPDAGNMPRIDPETGQGLVTDVCLKRKVRDFVALDKKGDEGFRIYVQNDGVALNTKHQQAYDAEKIKSSGTKQKREEVMTVRQRMCKEYFDIRLFGAVMTTGVNAGQVRGPVQLTFSRSVSPIASLEVSITRVAITKPEDAEFVAGDGENEKDKGGKVTEMGRKALLPYGLYVAKGFFSPAFAAQTGVSETDLELFWNALQMMLDQDHSAARGQMCCQGLYVFTHEKPLGNHPSHKLFDHLNITLKQEIEAPRKFSDYAVSLDETMPAGVTLTRLVG